MYRSTLLSAEEQDALQYALPYSGALMTLKSLMINSRKGLTTAGSEMVSAKYVIGCDGAHSWVRRQLGINMVGEQTSTQP